MKLHPRTMIVQAAQIDVSIEVTAILEKYDLTYIEVLAILNGLEARWLKHALRDERHPDEPDRGADQA